MVVCGWFFSFSFRCIQPHFTSQSPAGFFLSASYISRLFLARKTHPLYTIHSLLVGFVYVSVLQLHNFLSKYLRDIVHIAHTKVHGNFMWDIWCLLNIIGKRAKKRVSLCTFTVRTDFSLKIVLEAPFDPRFVYLNILWHTQRGFSLCSKFCTKYLRWKCIKGWSVPATLSVNWITFQ